MEWTEIIMKVPSAQLEQAADMAQMAVDGGIYVEDYSHLEEEAREIAHIDLIDEELLAKDACFSLKQLAVNGQDMMALGLQGPAIGKMLQALLDAVMDGVVENERNALLSLAQTPKN